MVFISAGSSSTFAVGDFFTTVVLRDDNKTVAIRPPILPVGRD